MATATSGSRLSNLIGKVGKLFKKSPTPARNNINASLAVVKKKLIRPVVPASTGWKTAELSVTSDDHMRSLSELITRRYAVSKGYVLRLLREGRIIMKRARPIEAPITKLKEEEELKNIRTWRPIKSLKVEKGDLITFTDVILAPRTKVYKDSSEIPNGVMPEYIQKLVLYKDEKIIILNKPTGIAVHGGRNHNENNVARWLSALRFGNDSDPLIVHRLDKDTSGVLMLARNPGVAADLAGRLRENDDNKEIAKYYLAMVKGEPSKDRMSGEIVTNIYKISDKENNEKMTSFADKRRDILDQGKVAITKYRWLHEHLQSEPKREKFSLLELIPVTGRTHQLRVHMAEQLKLPIVGDYRYYPMQVAGLKMHLHCRRITLWDWSGEGKHLTVIAGLPDHFSKTMESHPIKLHGRPKFAVKKKKKMTIRMMA